MQLLESKKARVLLATVLVNLLYLLAKKWGFSVPQELDLWVIQAIDYLAGLYLLGQSFADAVSKGATSTGAQQLKQQEIEVENKKAGIDRDRIVEWRHLKNAIDRLLEKQP